MVINIMDRKFSFLGQIDNYESLILGKKFHAVGGFEMYLHETNAYADKLQKEIILFTATNKAYIIMYRQIDSATGTVIIRGLELKSYLKRIITFPPPGMAYHRINSNAETIMKDIVTANLTRKNISEITIAPNQNRGPTTIFQTRYKNLADELEKISLATGIGWDVTLDLDNKTFVFDVIESRDLTAGQTEHPPAIFSLEYDNIAKQTLVESRLDYANVAIVAGQGEGADRDVIILGDTEGLDNYEMFVDARDLDNIADLPARGEQKLAETQEILIFDSEVLTDKNLIYGEDFNLGDVATLKNDKWNITADRRITGLTEIYEIAGFRLMADFGEGLPTVMDKIKRATDVPIAEGSEYEHPDTHSAGIITIEDTAGNFTATNVEGALTELFTNVSNGKDLIATAITDMGGTASGSNTFVQLASAISAIDVDPITEFIAGDGIVLTSAPTQRSTTSRSYIKLKEIQVLKSGTVAVSFGLGLSGRTSQVRAKIYVNDIARGIERTVTYLDDDTTFTENIDVNAGDLVQLYAYNVAANGSARVWDFQISTDIILDLSKYATVEID